MTMSELINNTKPFRFHTRLHLTQLTGLKASSLTQLLRYIRKIPGSCIYYHTHRFLQSHLYLSPEPPNDFAYWVTEILGEDTLGEMLASIDTVQFSTIRALREKIASTIKDYIKTNPIAKRRFAGKGNEFHFMKAKSFVVPTHYVANNLREFLDILKSVTIDSIYFHIFEARLRLNRQSNDFSYWIATTLGNKMVALEIEKLDPYTITLDGLRKKLIKIVRKGAKNTNG